MTTYRGHSRPVFCLAWSPDSRYIASGAKDGTVQVWEAHSGSLLTTYRGHRILVMGVAWSPTASLIASMAWDGDGAHIWEALTGRPIHWFRAAVTTERALAWSPDGRRLAVGGFRVAHVWDVDREVLLLDLSGRTGFTSGPTSIAWSPDGERLALADVGGTVYVRAVETGQRGVRFRAHRGMVGALAYSPDGRFLALTGPGATCQVRDAATGELVTWYRGHPTGRPIETRGFLHKPAPRHWISPSTVWDVCWSPNGKYMASSAGSWLPEDVVPQPEHNAVHVWEAATGRRVHTYAGHTVEVRAVAWSPDEHYIASGGKSSTVQVWEAPAGSS